MTHTLAFDVYGTLIDTNGVVVELNKMIGDKASDFSRIWREKQLEYTFRRGVMDRYQDFSVCTQDALNFTCSIMQIELSSAQRKQLIESYSTLPIFEDVLDAFKMLQDGDYKLYAFSNGRADAVHSLLEYAGILHYFVDVISTDEIQTFKPNPAVYHHLLKRCHSQAKSSCLISGNAFDVLGAKSAGLNGVWLKRMPGAVFDPWNDLSADATITALTALDAAIQAI